MVDSTTVCITQVIAPCLWQAAESAGVTPGNATAPGFALP